MPDNKIYESLTGVGMSKIKGKRHCEELLEGADFWWIKTASSSSYFSPTYPSFRAAILKSEEIYKSMIKLIEKYQEREIPHEGVRVAAEKIEALLESHSKVKQSQVNKILTTYK